MEVTYYFAFVAGLVSFLSPCVVPLIPGFIAYLGGTTLEQASTHRRDVLTASVFFVLGFGLVFAILGVLLNTLLETFAFTVQGWVAKVGGIIIILFGLYLLGVFKIKFLARDHKIRIRHQFKSRKVNSFLFGAAFAAGWTSCASAILGSIFALAAVSPVSAFSLLLIYSAGLGLPFILTGIFTAQVSSLIGRHLRLIGFINKAFGVFLILIGLLVFTQRLAQFAQLGSLVEFFMR